MSEKTFIKHAPIMAFCIYMSLIAPAIAEEPSEVIPKPLTTDWVIQEIAKHGPKHAVRVMWDQERYDELLGNISAGKEEWIALAPKIVSGTDAGASEELGISLADALPKNPKAVLGILDQSKWTISSGRVCSIPFIEPEKDFYESYAKSALVAVKAVSDAGLAKQ
jgi:hypothetical protein